MAFKLQRSDEESTAGIVRRVAREQLDAVHQALAGWQDDPDVAVHEARKQLKKLRALLRLVRDALGESVYKKENRAYRDAGRALAGPRDARVRVQVADSLIEKNENPEAAEALRAIARRFQAGYDEATGGDRVPGAIHAATDLLAGAAGRIDDWPLADDAGFALFQGGLKRVYRRGRRGFKTCLANPSIANLHDWRKRCKYLRHQLGLLGPAWPELLDATEDAMHELTNRLGDDHDLAMLRQTIADGIHDELEIPHMRALDAVLEAGHRELVDRCRHPAACHFAEQPKHFLRRMKAYWNA